MPVDRSGSRGYLARLRSFLNARSCQTDVQNCKAASLRALDLYDLAEISAVSRRQNRRCPTQTFVESCLARPTR
jgi:hypothetical protein